MLTKCAICDKDELLPFTCRYCGQSFCAEHRLPESHNCPMIGAKVITMRRMESGEGRAFYTRPSAFRTSRTELLHLAAGVLVFFAVEAPSFLRYGMNILAIIAGTVALAFIIHELAHKFTAQYYGLWSEFRLDPRGTLISLLLAFSPIKIIAPGAVVIFGSNVTSESMGKIALAGPLSNIVQVLVFTALSRFSILFLFAAALNADLAIFNLIPFSILDGQKVFAWSKKTWAAAFMTAFVLWIILNMPY